jgi:hypothetical protein
MLRKARFLLLFLVTVAPVAAQTLKVDYDHKVDFSQYKTYAWSEAQEPVRNAANHLRITRAVERELEAKGLARSKTATPGLRLRYFGKVATKIYGESHQVESPWQPSNLRTVVDIKSVKEGTLILELSDARSGSVVWRAASSEALGRPDVVEDQINDVVKRLLQDFPPKAP